MRHEAGGGFAQDGDVKAFAFDAFVHAEGEVAGKELGRGQCLVGKTAEFSQRIGLAGPEELPIERPHHPKALQAVVGGDVFQDTVKSGAGRLGEVGKDDGVIREPHDRHKLGVRAYVLDRDFGPVEAGPRGRRIDGHFFPLHLWACGPGSAGDLAIGRHSPNKAQFQGRF